MFTRLIPAAMFRPRLLVYDPAAKRNENNPHYNHMERKLPLSSDAVEKAADDAALGNDLGMPGIFDFKHGK